jgi:CheY-like chemotaxis protein
MGIVADLEDAGFTVCEAANADAAIVLLQSNPNIRMLFTDVDMPGGMNGLKLAAAVRNRWPPVKIIVTSGQFELSDADLPEGGRFFAKPYNGVAIAAAFREMAA